MTKIIAKNCIDCGRELSLDQYPGWVTQRFRDNPDRHIQRCLACIAEVFDALLSIVDTQVEKGIDKR